MSNKIAILTVNYNGEEKTIKLINSLKKSSYRNYVVYVVDNGSDNEAYISLRNKLNTYKSKVKLIKSEKNLGWGMGCNLGLKEIIRKKIKYTFVVGNDSIIDKNTLEECYKFMESNKKVGICGVKSLNEDGTIQTVGGVMKAISNITGMFFENKLRHSEKKPVILNESEFVDDYGWMIRSKSEEEIAWYPNHLFMYSEEVYVNKEMRKKGKLIAYNPRAKISHEGHGSSGGNKNPIPVFYINRNRFVFVRDFYPYYLPITLLLHILLIFPAIMIKYSLAKRIDLIPYLFLAFYSALTQIFFGKKLFLVKENGKFFLKRY